MFEYTCIILLGNQGSLPPKIKYTVIRQYSSYRVLSLLQQWALPCVVEENHFSSVNTTLDQNSRSCSEWSWAKANLPFLCCCVRRSFLAGTRWCIPPLCNLRLTVSAQTPKLRVSLIATAFVRGFASAAFMIAASSTSVVLRGGPGLSTKNKWINK